MKKKTTKKWIRILITLGIMGLLIAIAFSLTFWFYPYPRYIAWKKTPLLTEQYLDRPDQILIRYDGRTIILRNDEKVSEAYEAFWTMVGEEIVRVEKYPMDKTPHTDEYLAKKRNVSDYEMCVEFRYKQRRAYEVKEWNEIEEYDAVALIFYTISEETSQFPEAMITCKSLDGKYSLSSVGPVLEICGELEPFVNYVKAL